MKIDMVVIRHQASGAARFLAERIESNVINAGDGTHEHPTQGLLDLLTLRDKWGSLQGRRVCLVGDVLHSRVARSNIHGLRKLGADVGVCGPRSLLPNGAEEALGVTVFDRIEAAIEWADAQNEADAELYYSPLDNEDYQDFLFASYYELKEQADATIAEGNQANVYGDRLTLTTVLMAISLFLLGIAAVVGTFRTRLVLGGISIVIFLVAAGIMLAVPALPLWT